MTGALAILAGLLPAIFWLFYTLWNTALTDPPMLGPLTPINALYLLMFPATLVMAWRWPRTAMAGAWAYLAFLAWLALGMLWHHRLDGEQIKALFVCALALLIAAQLLAGWRGAPAAFAASVTLVAIVLSLWMVEQALASGFQYRTGTLLNQNFVATMVAPGLLIALAWYLAREDGRVRRALLAIVLVCGYASLLLGSRGVLIGELVAAAALAWQVRPTLQRIRGLLAGTAIVIVMAQLPMIPNAIWRTGWHAVTMVEASFAPGAPSSAPSTRTKAANGSRGASAAPEGTEPTPRDRPLNPFAAQSTALSRFVEKDTGTLNLRSSLWRATVAYAFSGPVTLLAGGGLGTSGEVANRANPVFHNAHNAYLQMLDDGGLIGLALLTWLFWSLIRGLSKQRDPLSHAWLAVLVFWMVAGLTATVIDLHVCWASVGAAMAATAVIRAPRRQPMVAEVAA